MSKDIGLVIHDLRQLKSFGDTFEYQNESIDAAISALEKHTELEEYGLAVLAAFKANCENFGGMYHTVAVPRTGFEETPFIFTAEKLLEWYRRRKEEGKA